MYRKDLFDAAGLKMPDQPTYTQIESFAKALTKRDAQQYGICLRGKPGWGENMAFIDTVVNTFGGRWFDEKWKPQLDQPAWKTAVNFYVHMLKDYGPPGASSNGFNENLALFETGHCAMWIDATSAAGFVADKKSSKVADTGGLRAGADGDLAYGCALVLDVGACSAQDVQADGDRQVLPRVGDLA